MFLLRFQQALQASTRLMQGRPRSARIQGSTAHVTVLIYCSRPHVVALSPRSKNHKTLSFYRPPAGRGRTSFQGNWVLLGRRLVEEVAARSPLSSRCQSVGGAVTDCWSRLSIPTYLAPPRLPNRIPPGIFPGINPGLRRGQLVEASPLEFHWTMLWPVKFGFFRPSIKIDVVNRDEGRWYSGLMRRHPGKSRYPAAVGAQKFWYVRPFKAGQ